MYMSCQSITLMTVTIISESGRAISVYGESVYYVSRDASVAKANSTHNDLGFMTRGC